MVISDSQCGCLSNSEDVCWDFHTRIYKICTNAWPHDRTFKLWNLNFRASTFLLGHWLLIIVFTVLEITDWSYSHSAFSKNDKNCHKALAIVCKVKRLLYRFPQNLAFRCQWNWKLFILLFFFTDLQDFEKSYLFICSYDDTTGCSRFLKELMVSTSFLPICWHHPLNVQFST